MVAKTKYARSGDVSIAYQVVGKGPRDLILAPGFVSHAEVLWENPDLGRFLDRLSSFARLIIFDNREQGLSDRIGRAPTVEEMVDDMNAVLEAAGSERAAVIGVSEGGAIALTFAATHPDRCTHLVIWGGYARVTRAPDYEHGFTPEYLERWAEQMAGEWGGPVALERFAPSRVGDAETERWWAHLLRSGTSPRSVSALMELYKELDVRHVLSVISAPTLILHRTEDRVVPIELGRYLAERIPGARFVEFPGRDHLLFTEGSDEVAGEIEEFITGTRQAHTPERILATVLFTDIVDSTGHAARLGDQRWRELLDRHDSFVRREVERYHGRLVQTTGDGILATFDGPARAIECGAEIVRGVQALGIEVRAGLHSGECERRNGGLGGMAVHIGARVAARAEGGEVLVSSTVKDLVVGSGIEFDDRGPATLKGVPGEWRLYRVEPTPARTANGAEARRLRRSARRRLPLAIGALAAVAAAAVAGVLLLSGGGGSDGEPAARPQPKRVATVEVRESPTGISVGGDSVWVASAGARAVEAIDPATDRLAGTPIRVDGRPISVAVGFGSVWVVNHIANTVVRLDPGERPTSITIPVGGQPTDVAIDDRWVWVTNGGSDTVSRVDPVINRVDETVQVSASPRSVAAGEGAVWVANIEGKSVSRIDPEQAKTIGHPISLGQRPNDLAVGYGSVWVIDNVNGTLTRIDPDAAPVVGDPIVVGSHPRGVTTGFGYIWVANGGDGTVTRIDPKSAAPAGPPIPVGRNPADIAVGKGAVWTANFDSSTVTKIRP